MTESAEEKSEGFPRRGLFVHRISGTRFFGSLYPIPLSQILKSVCFSPKPC